MLLPGLRLSSYLIYTSIRDTYYLFSLCRSTPAIIGSLTMTFPRGSSLYPIIIY